MADKFLPAELNDISNAVAAFERSGVLSPESRREVSDVRRDFNTNRQDINSFERNLNALNDQNPRNNVGAVENIINRAVVRGLKP